VMVHNSTSLVFAALLIIHLSSCTGSFSGILIRS
jgi:hypothetical protein